MRRFHLVLAGVAGAMAFGAGLLLGDARDDRTTVALAPAGEPVPYVAAGGAPPELLEANGATTDPDGGGAGGSGERAAAESEPGLSAADLAWARAHTPTFAPVLAGSSGAGRSDADGADDLADSADEAADGDPGDGGTARGDGTAGTAGTADGDNEHRRFTDPCAGAAPEDPERDGLEEHCPFGVGAVVLIDDDGLPVPPPLTIEDPWMGPMFVAGSEDRCPVGVDPDGKVHTIVLTNVPATVTLTLEVRGERHVLTSEPTVAERNRFMSRLLDGEPIAGDQVNGVQTCFTFESLPESLNAQEAGGGRVVHWYQPAVHAVDDAGHEVSHEPGFLQMRVADDHGALRPFAEPGEHLTDGPGAPAELRIGTASFTALPQGVRARCPMGVEDEALRGVVTASVPATMQLTVIDRGRSLPMGTAEATADERRLHGELLASGEAPATSGAAAVQHCVSLEGVHKPGTYYLDVAARSDDGSTATARLPFTITEAMADGLPSVTFGRPQPSVVAADGAFTVYVHFDSGEEHVLARALHRTGERATGDDCTSVEPAALRGGSPGPGVEMLPARTRGQWVIPMPWEQPEDRFDKTVPIRVWAGEGDVIDLCTWVVTKPRGAFDPTVEERRSFRLEAPRRMRIAIDLTWIHASTRRLIGRNHMLPIEAHRYTITALNWPGQPSATFPPRNNQGSEQWGSQYCVEGQHYCTSERLTLLDSGSRFIPEVTRLRITDVDGRSVETQVPTPTTCLRGRRTIGDPSCSYGSPESHYLDLPDNEGPLCINDCNGRRFFSLRVHPYEGIAGPPGPTPLPEGREWRYRDDGPFERGTLELPTTPRVDLTLDTPTVIPPAAPPEEGGRPGARLELPFDRPVDVEVVPELREPIPESCDLPTEQRSAEPKARHVFVFEDLCYGATYWFHVHATDPVGGGRLDLPGMIFWRTMPGVPVVAVAVSLDVAGQVPMRSGTLHGTVTLGNAVVELAHVDGRGTCLDEYTWLELAGEARRTGTQRLEVGDHTAFLMDLTWVDCDGRRHRMQAGRGMQLPELLPGSFTYHASEDGISAGAEVTIAFRR